MFLKEEKGYELIQSVNELLDTDMNKIAKGESPYQITIPADTTVTREIDFQTGWLESVGAIEDLINPFKDAI